MTRIVVSAALLTDDGVIHSMPQPARHHDILHALAARGDVPEVAQGFLTSDGTFASRIDAAKVAIDSEQIANLNSPPKLYSEDLW